MERNLNEYPKADRKVDIGPGEHSQTCSWMGTTPGENFSAEIESEPAPVVIMMPQADKLRIRSLAELQGQLARLDALRSQPHKTNFPCEWQS